MAALLAILPACTRERAPNPGAPSASASVAVKRERARVSRVEIGMSEEQVLAIAGAASEVRHADGKGPWIVGASAAWAYGSRAPGEFAFGGVVLFDAGKKVMMVRSPLSPASVRARRLRWSDTADVADRGLSCHLAVLGADATGVDARVTLRNEGAAPMERRHGHTGIRFDLVVELFDEKRNVLAREDTLSLFSPYSPDDTEVMRIPPGGELSEKVRLGATWTDLGKLPPGRYWIRVAFPFEVGHFSVSEPVAFTIGG